MPYEWAQPPEPEDAPPRSGSFIKRYAKTVSEGTKRAGLFVKVKIRSARGRPAHLDERILRATHLKDIADSRHNNYFMRDIDPFVKAGMSKQRIKLASSKGLASMSTLSTIVVTAQGWWVEVSEEAKMYRVLYRDFEEGANSLKGLPKEQWKVETNFRQDFKERSKKKKKKKKKQDCNDHEQTGVDNGTAGSGSASIASVGTGWIPILEPKVPDPDLASLYAEEDEEEAQAWRKEVEQKRAEEQKKADEQKKAEEQKKAKEEAAIVAPN